jgi:hypothetical protein
VKDNHSGPRLDEVRRAYPEATRFHWSEQMGGIRYWMVGRPIQCGGGAGFEWLEVPLSALPH